MDTPQLNGALDRVIEELAAEERARCDDTMKIRIGLTPDWLIIVAVSIGVGVFVGALVATRWVLT